jgi:hypothetical protein
MVYSIFLYPVDGSLDVVAIERFLAQQPDVLPDPLGTGTYLVPNQALPGFHILPRSFGMQIAGHAAAAGRRSTTCRAGDRRRRSLPP